MAIMDTVLAGYRIPKGTLVFTPGNHTFAVKEDWGDPDVLRPER